MPTAWASWPEEMRPSFSLARMARRLPSASAARISDTPMKYLRNYFKFSLIIFYQAAEPLSRAVSKKFEMPFLIRLPLPLVDIQADGWYLKITN